MIASNLLPIRPCNHRELSNLILSSSCDTLSQSLSKRPVKRIHDVVLDMLPNTQSHNLVTGVWLNSRKSKATLQYL